MRPLFSNNKGFTLLEAILSLATLALLSGFILQMFIVAAGANDRAQNIDIASTRAATLIESIKALDQREMLTDGDILSGFSSDGESYYKEFDADWNETADTDAVFLMRVSLSEETVPNSEKFVPQSFSVGGGQQTELTGAGTMTDIAVEVLDLTADADKQTIVVYEASKYFSE